MALYRVNDQDETLTEIDPTTLEHQGLKEVGDLQRWLSACPDALERGLFVLAEGYRDWEDSRREIDILALDKKGRLVVVELKRNEDRFMDLQAIHYAALAAHMTFAKATEAHDAYLRRQGKDGDARKNILNHLGLDDDTEPEIESAKPRILLAARNFPLELTTAVLWLNDADLDIRCVRLLPYRINGSLFLDTNQVIPPPETGEYTGRRRAREAEQETVQRSKRPDTPITAFYLDGERHLVRSWRDMLREVYEIAADEAGEEFQEKARSIPRIKISVDQSQIIAPHPLSNGLYAELNFNASDSQRYARELLIAVRGEGGADSFRIEPLLSDDSRGNEPMAEASEA